jgi:hypothetical protein
VFENRDIIVFDYVSGTFSIDFGVADTRWQVQPPRISNKGALKVYMFPLFVIFRKNSKSSKIGEHIRNDVLLYYKNADKRAKKDVRVTRLPKMKEEERNNFWHRRKSLETQRITESMEITKRTSKNNWLANNNQLIFLIYSLRN